MRKEQITLWNFDTCWTPPGPETKERAKHFSKACQRLDENEKLKLLIRHNDSSGVWSTIFLGICLV